MDESIEREALLDSICHDTCRIAFCGATNCAFIAKVCSAPAADVAPVVHGRWIHDGCRVEGGIDWCHCSECGKSDNFCARTNYCPNCGGKMDGGADHAAD